MGNSLKGIDLHSKTTKESRVVVARNTYVPSTMRNKYITKHMRA